MLRKRRMLQYYVLRVVRVCTIQMLAFSTREQCMQKEAYIVILWICVSFSAELCNVCIGLAVFGTRFVCHVAQTCVAFDVAATVVSAPNCCLLSFLFLAVRCLCLYLLLSVLLGRESWVCFGKT